LEECKIGGHVAHMGQMRKACRILVEKYQMTALSEIPRCKWGSNFKMGLRKIL
jgi:hypothetical protein